MATPDGVTPGCAADYGLRCQAIGRERRTTSDLQCAMNHPRFKAEHHLFLDRLAAEYRQYLPFIERPPFATIEIGTFEKVAFVRRAIQDYGSYVTEGARDLMDRPAFVLAGESIKLDLYRVSNEELGFSRTSTIAQSFAALEKIGAAELSSEAGLQYYLQYLGGSSAVMYQKPIIDSRGRPMVFATCHNSNGWFLNSRHAYPESGVVPIVSWVYCRRS